MESTLRCQSSGPAAERKDTEREKGRESAELSANFVWISDNAFWIYNERIEVSIEDMPRLCFRWQEATPTPRHFLTHPTRDRRRGCAFQRPANHPAGHRSTLRKKESWDSLPSSSEPTILVGIVCRWVFLPHRIISAPATLHWSSCC